MQRWNEVGIEARLSRIAVIFAIALHSLPIENYQFTALIDGEIPPVLNCFFLGVKDGSRAIAPFFLDCPPFRMRNNRLVGK
jgi:hypothetical protein